MSTPGGGGGATLRGGGEEGGGGGSVRLTKIEPEKYKTTGYIIFLL